MYKTIFLILASVLIISCKKDSVSDNPAKTIEDYLVKNNEISGWTASGSKWTAYSINTLTVYIDGAAEVYKKYSFVEAAQQEYQGQVNGKSAVINLMVFNQTNNANAKNLYNDPDLGFSGSIPWTGAGEAAHYLRNGGLSQQLSFYRGGYYIYLDISTDTEESLNVLKQFATNVDKKIM